MLVIIEGYKKEPCKLYYVQAINNCDFAFNESSSSIYVAGSEFTSKICVDRQAFYEFRVYKSCNDERPLYRVLLSEAGIFLRERLFDEDD